jgi:hypothetical protein
MTASLIYPSIQPVSSRRIALIMGAASASETSVNLHDTLRRCVPEGYHLHTLQRENIKSHLISFYKR